MPNKQALFYLRLPQEVQADIAKRIATMDSTSPEVISEIEAVLKGNCLLR